MGKTSHLLALGLCLSLCVYSATKQMQFLAFSTLILALCIIYKQKTLTILEIITRLMSSAKQAKYGKWELNLDQKEVDFSDKISSKLAWVKIMLSQMNSSQIGLLLSIHKVGKLQVTDALKSNLRSLRAIGLILHNEKTMEASSEVWLTEIGEDLAKIIIDSNTVVEEEIIEKSEP